MPVEDPDEPVERLHISLSQVAASSLAAVSAAVLCSFFGVAGTIIGTAVASVAATVGGALYAHTLRRTKARLRRLHQAGAASPPFGEVLKTARQQGRALLGQVPWRIAGTAAVIVFVVSIGVITAIEAGAGQTLSSLFGVSHSGAHGTSFGSVVDPKHKHHHKATPSSTPSSPSPTPTVTKTVTSTPTHSPTTSTSPSTSSSTSTPPSSTPAGTPPASS